jgi:hypothetical protein
VLCVSLCLTSSGVLVPSEGDRRDYLACGELYESGFARRRASARVVELSFSSRRRVTDGTRTRNSQNHNLELYH